MMDFINNILRIIDNHGNKVVKPFIIAIFIFLITMSPILIFILLYLGDIINTYNIILVIISVCSISVLIFTFIFCSTLVFSSLILGRIIEYKKIEETEESGYLIKINTILTTSIIILGDILLFFYHFYFYQSTYSTGLKLLSQCIYIFIFSYFLISIICNICFFKSSNNK